MARIRLNVLRICGSQTAALIMALSYLRWVNSHLMGASLSTLSRTTLLILSCLNFLQFNCDVFRFSIFRFDDSILQFSFDVFLIACFK